MGENLHERHQLCRGREEHTKLDDDLTEVIRMPAPREQAGVTYGALVTLVRGSEAVLLHIAYALDGQADHENHNSRNVAALAE